MRCYNERNSQTIQNLVFMAFFNGSHLAKNEKVDLSHVTTIKYIGKKAVDITKEILKEIIGNQ